MVRRKRGIRLFGARRTHWHQTETAASGSGIGVKCTVTETTETVTETEISTEISPKPPKPIISVEVDARSGRVGSYSPKPIQKRAILPEDKAAQLRGMLKNQLRFTGPPGTAALDRVPKRIQVATEKVRPARPHRIEITLPELRDGFHPRAVDVDSPHSALIARCRNVRNGGVRGRAAFLPGTRPPAFGRIAPIMEARNDEKW